MSMDEYAKPGEIYCSTCHELIDSSDEVYYNDEHLQFCEKCYDFEFEDLCDECDECDEE